ncbi:MAG: EscU/YscU/HrcU family type III secretion system export apparatus switch protein [Nitrospirae bacterium]|nr:EscU/YscU/HrcU family type III secretion system export apparatus switch protein [Nitrospirota bacterium]
MGVSLIDRLGAGICPAGDPSGERMLPSDRPGRPDVIVATDFDTDPAIAVGLVYVPHEMEAPVITGAYRGPFAETCIYRAVMNDVPLYLDFDHCLPEALAKAARSSSVVPRELYWAVSSAYVYALKKNPTRNERLVRFRVEVLEVANA